MRALIIRFSSIGDVLQALSIVGKIRAEWPNASIDWVVREDLRDLVLCHPDISKVYTVAKGASWQNLWQLSRVLRKQSYTHVYDAHNNLRSRLLCWAWLGPMEIFRWALRVRFLRRPSERWKRPFLFWWRINFFSQPFSGQRTLLKPLSKWGLSNELPRVPQIKVPKDVCERVKAWLPPPPFVTLVASAAYPLKRWPIDHWQKLVDIFPDKRFVLLGGKDDSFLNAISERNPNRVINLVGKLTLLESVAVVKISHQVVANDTGLMHAAEQLGVPCVALMGPAPFGYPSRESTRILERTLPCKPCSKHGQGPCKNSLYQHCLRDISPQEVAQLLNSNARLTTERTEMCQ